jgi:hypothetical protein
MKKLFTLVALLAMVLGASAQTQWEEVYSIDYTTYQGFPFYVMGYVPEFDGGYMTDHGASYRYAEVKDDAEETSDVIVTTQSGAKYYRWTEGGGWHQYFIADNITTVIDETYKVVAKVKASEAVTFNVNMGWGWGEGQSMGASVSIPQSDEFVEVEWEYSGIGGSSCNLVAQPGGATATIDWQSLKVYHKMKANQRPKEWIEAITSNADAESAWPAWSLEETDGVNINWRGDRTGEICAWALTMGRNFQPSVINDDSDRARPFPADIVADETKEGNHVFVVDAAQVAPVSDDDAASVAWANQFWIQSNQGWKSGTQIKLHFRYRADHACTVGTQIHKQHPSDYLHWEGIGTLNFTESWTEFDKTITFSDAQAGGWSVAFNLNSDEANGRTANKFYFDDFSWQYLKLDEGFFVSGINATTTTSYDNLDNAIQFVEEDGNLVATVGEKGNNATYVDQIMVSTVRGDDAAFKGATLKPNGKIKNDPEEWLDYAPSTNAKLDLPGLGVWKVYIDTKYNAMAFQMLEGKEYEEAEPVAIVTNATNVVVKGQERDWKPAKDDGTPQDGEEGIGTGQPWDNQFFLIANRVVKAGEATVVKFKYKASVAGATSGTQCQGEPGAYIHWAAIGSITFGEDWQDFEKDFTIPAECDGSEGKQFKSIAFNLAEIKAACNYEFKDFQWYLSDPNLAEGMTYENLIDAEGTKFFYVKEGAGTNPYEFGTDPSGINSVINDAKNASAVTYNIAGQRVSKDYKGLVIKEGKKYVVK